MLLAPHVSFDRLYLLPLAMRVMRIYCSIPFCITRQDELRGCWIQQHIRPAFRSSSKGLTILRSVNADVE